MRDRLDEAIDAVRRTDVVSEREKRTMLAALHALRGAPCASPSACADRSCPRCTRRIEDILGM